MSTSGRHLVSGAHKHESNMWSMFIKSDSTHKNKNTKAPGDDRNRNLRLRRSALYPIKLRGHTYPVRVSIPWPRCVFIRVTIRMNVKATRSTNWANGTSSIPMRAFLETRPRTRVTICAMRQSRFLICCIYHKCLFDGTVGGNEDLVKKAADAIHFAVSIVAHSLSVICNLFQRTNRWN